MGYAPIRIRKTPFQSGPPGAHNLSALMRYNPNTIAKILVLEKKPFKNFAGLC